MPRRDLKPMQLPLPPLPRIPSRPRSSSSTTLQRRDIKRHGGIIPLTRAQLIVLVAAPPHDVGAPVGVVLAAALVRAHVRDVVHGRGRVRAADAEAAQADGHHGRGFLVVLEEAGERFDFRRRPLHVCPAAVAEPAVDALAAGPGVRGDAAEAGSAAAATALAGEGGGVSGLASDAGGVYGEEGVDAAGGDGGDAREEIGAVVEFLDGEEGGGVDVGGFGAVVEAELAEGVVAEGEGAAFTIDGKGVVVACCHGGDFEATQGADFVGGVVGAWGPRCPC